MSWLSDLTNKIGGVFGANNLGNSISDLLPNIFSYPNIGPVANGNTYADMLGQGKSIWDSPLLWNAIIQGGTGLTNQFFQQSQDKSLAEAYAAQQKAALDAQLALKEKEIAAQKEIAGISAGAHIKAAGIAAGAQKKNTLANLYNNWASNTQRAGESEGQLAQNIGGMIGRSLDARAAGLSR